MSSLRDLREAMHSHVLRNTILPDAEEQKSKQAAAAATHERLSKIYERTMEIYREWRAADLGRLKELSAANEAELKKLETAAAR
jgi:hypothetical protein